MKGPALIAVLLLGAACDGGAEGPSRDGASGAAAGASGSPLAFRDVTSESGISMTITSGRTPSTQILEVKGGGLALIDFDDDQDLDLFVPNGATLEAPEKGPGARLFENDGRARFRDVTAESGITLTRWSFGTAVGDYDGDGRDDLFVAGFGRSTLLRNLGGGRFEDVTDAAGVAGSGWASAAAFGDLDQDGDLDLYVVRYLRFDPEHPAPPMSFLGVQVFAGPRGLEPEPDLVYENLGDGRFRDVTKAWGFDAVPAGYGLGAVILDFNGDRDPEVFVGNDSQPNFLFVRREDGRFADVGIRSGIAVNEDGSGQATMGIAIADVDGNGHPDVFTTNFMNDTNTLHVNLGDLFFEDRTQRWGLGLVSRPYLGWAAMFFDFDQDRDEDLLVFNGHTYPEVITEPRGWMHDQPPLYFERSGERFELVGPDRAGAFVAERHCDRSASFGDLDRDGDIDVIVGELNGPIRVLENVGSGKGHWLVVRLADPRPESMNRRGLGARVELVQSGRRQVRWLHGGGSYQAASMPWVHFGLGDDASPVDLVVAWPGGGEQQADDVAVDRHVTVERR